MRDAHTIIILFLSSFTFCFVRMYTFCCCGIRFNFYWSVPTLRWTYFIFMQIFLFSLSHRLCRSSIFHAPTSFHLSRTQLASLRFLGSSHIRSSVVYYVRSFVLLFFFLFISSPLYRFFFSRPDCDKRNMYSRKKKKNVNHIHVNSIWELNKKKKTSLK